MATAQKSTTTTTLDAAALEAQLANLLSTKAVSTGSKSLAKVFEEIAKANGNVVTFEQAKAISPKSPSDLAFYFRKAGGKIATSRGKEGGTSWTVIKLSNGELGYPENVKKEVERLKAELANVKKQ